MDGESLCNLLEVLVLPAVVTELALEVLVGALLNPVLRGADVVQDSQDSGIGTAILDEGADDGVVEVLDGTPLDPLLHVLFLKDICFLRYNIDVFIDSTVTIGS